MCSKRDGRKNRPQVNQKVLRIELNVIALFASKLPTPTTFAGKQDNDHKYIYDNYVKHVRLIEFVIVELSSHQYAATNMSQDPSDEADKHSQKMPTSIPPIPNTGDTDSNARSMGMLPSARTGTIFGRPSSLVY